MGKKLKKDFKERHKASIEREILHSETGITPEESKLKHNDDYRGKIVHDKERFQDKVHKKTSKINDDDNPLGKDLDNDGIIDRYDNDFRDSDYFESTYDVEDNLHHKAENTISFSKSQKAQKKNYKRKNYTESLYTRKKDDVLKENKPEDKKTGKDTASKKVHSSIYKEQKKKLKKSSSTVKREM